MPRRAQRGHVPAHEIDGGAATKLLPRERSVLTRRQELVAEHGDRPLAGLVDVRQRATLRAGRVPGVHGDAAGFELLARAPPEVVVGECREEEARAAEVGQLDGSDGPAAGGLLPRLERVHDLPRLGRLVDSRELDPLDVTDDGDLHISHLERRLGFTP